MKKIILGFLLTGLLSMSLVHLARAFLKDTETSYGNPVTGATLNLRVGETDPSIFQFGFENVKPGEIHQFWVAVVSDGGVAGNFWMQVEAINSHEGVNPESETDTVGKGELDECAEVAIAFEQDGMPEPVTLLNWTPIMNVGTLDAGANTPVDQIVNSQEGKMHFMLRTDICGAEAMGDGFDVNLAFYLEQV